VSEYQYYEFLAVDRALDAHQLDEMRALSTRAHITPTSFVNTYHWGNFHGDPRRMVERYYDAFLYLANWGTRQIMIRLPARLLDPATAQRYCTTYSASAWPKEGNVILHLTRESDEGDWIEEDGEGRLASIISARSDLDWHAAEERWQTKCGAYIRAPPWRALLSARIRGSATRREARPAGAGRQSLSMSGPAMGPETVDCRGRGVGIGPGQPKAGPRTAAARRGPFLGHE
jgi:hypothetical protein